MADCPHCGYRFIAPAERPAPPEPPVGTWVKDRFGAVHYRNSEGWAAAPTGFHGFGRWKAMWEGRGPLVECGPWGKDAKA